ncbi:ankyrin repeat domain-containing protein [Jejuia pallidilutea]|uniref:Ankyrin-like protein n=1 Tax=Jejuia pallidilutea TaxID=504487 RepID=A0A090WCK8_9FLAO|nr:ankyrin repeat domain-containing protein [Jejuia pallidilutea]GAL73169.1 ankyrin-like protein [Jejuia pallidilutea]
MEYATQFFGAIQSGDKNQIEHLLKLHPELVSTKDARGFTPLIFAAYFDKIDIVETLLSHKAPVNATDASGNTALIGVAFKGNIHLAQLLLKYGATINAQNNLAIRL